MRLTDKTIEAINKEYDAVKKTNNYHNGKRGLYVSTGFNTAVYSGMGGSGWHLSDLEELRATIDELEMLAQAITNITGIVI